MQIARGEQTNDFSTWHILSDPFAYANVSLGCVLASIPPICNTEGFSYDIALYGIPRESNFQTFPVARLAHSI